MLALSATILVDEGLAFLSSFLGGMFGDGERRRAIWLLLGGEEYSGLGNAHSC